MINAYHRLDYEIETDHNGNSFIVFIGIDNEFSD